MGASPSPKVPDEMFDAIFERFTSYVGESYGNISQAMGGNRGLLTHWKRYQKLDFFRIFETWPDLSPMFLIHGLGPKSLEETRELIEYHEKIKEEVHYVTTLLKAVRLEMENLPKNVQREIRDIVSTELITFGRDITDRTAGVLQEKLENTTLQLVTKDAK